MQLVHLTYITATYWFITCGAPYQNLSSQFLSCLNFVIGFVLIVNYSVV